MSHSTDQLFFLKDVQDLYRTIDSSTDGQASIVSVNELSVVVSLNPKFGRNAHASFIVNIYCPLAYPKASPDVRFITPIFHPNIYNGYGCVCLSLLTRWHSCYNLLDVIKALIYLIEYPNFESANNAFASDEKLFDEKTLRLLAGLRVNGRRFAPNQAWCEWAEANGCLPVDDEGLEDDLDDDEGAVHVEAQKEPNYHNESLPGVATYAHDVEADEKAHRRFSDASSETFPSFAKIRFSLDSLSSTSLWTCYTQDYPCSYFNTQRILISQPSMNTKPSPPSVFYYGELLGNPDYRGELGDHYSTLFTGDVLHAMQVHPESRQTSSPCPWYHYFISSHQSYWTNDSVFNLTNLFTFTEQRRPCGSNFSLDDDDGENLVQLSSKELEYSPQIFKSHEIAFDAEYEEEKEIEMQNMPVNGASSPTSSTTYHCSLFEYRPPKNSWRCFYDFNEAAISMNVQLRPRWHWMFRQTRWPLRFAPQQNIELSMNGIRIPPWRASAGRPLSDVSRFCSEHREMKNLVLLDPMVNFHLLF